MTSSRRPDSASRSATGLSSSIPSSTRVALCRSSPLSNSGTTSRTGGGAPRAASCASRWTAATSSADLVKLTTYRRQAPTPNLP